MAIKLSAIVLLVGFVTLVYASPVYDDDDDEAEIDLPGIMLPPVDSLPVDNVQDDPKPCCLPKQWQGDVTGQSGFSPSRRGEDEDEDRRRRGGRGGFQQRTTTVFVDEDKKSVAGRVAIRNDTAGFIVIFGANNTADLYLFKMGAQKCYHRKSNRAVFHQQCIPANSTYGGTVNVGPSDKGLAVQIWNFHGGPHRNGALNRGVFISGRALVTPDNCIPVIFQNHGFVRPGPRPHPPHRTTTKKSNGLKFESNNEEFFDDDDSQSELDEELIDGDRPGPRRGGGGFMGSSYFTNIQIGIKDPAVFTPPDYCSKTFSYGNTLQVGVDVEYPDILDRFVSLE